MRRFRAADRAHVSGIDLVVLGIILVSAVVGLVRGFLKELVSAGTWIVAVLVTTAFTSRFATVLPRDSLESPTARLVVSAFTLFVGIMLLGGLVGWLLARLSRRVRLGTPDRVLGALFGVARGAVVVALLVLAANLAPALKAEPWWRASWLLPRFQVAARAIHARLPRELARYFDTGPARPAAY